MGETFFHNNKYKIVKNKDDQEDDELMRGTTEDLEKIQNELLEDLEIKHLNNL